MDYKNKYLKYKQKYIELKNKYILKQIGGVQIKQDNVPAVKPATQSWLYMALIYDNLQDINMVFQFNMNASFLLAINMYNQNRDAIGNDENGKVLPELDFENYGDFKTLLLTRFSADDINIENRSQLIAPFTDPQVHVRFREDELCHFSQDSQEYILYMDEGIAPIEFYDALVTIIIRDHPGRTITYNTNP